MLLDVFGRIFEEIYLKGSMKSLPKVVVVFRDRFKGRKR